MNRRELLTSARWIALPALLSLSPSSSADHLVHLGKQVLRQFPEYGRIDNLSASVHEVLRASNPHQALAEQVRQDFERRDTLLVAGWQMSRSEAQWCAIHALAADARRL